MSDTELQQIMNKLNDMEQKMDSRFNKVDGELQVIREQVAHNSEFEPTIKELKIRVDEHDQDLMIMKRDLNKQ